jgi:hypothetical protein
MQLFHKHRVLLGLLTVGSATASAVATAGPPSTSAYFTDPQNTQVQDATSQSIGQVNMITCVMSSMRPDALVNQGPYAALIDKNKCDAQKESSTSNSGGSSGASQAPDYMSAIVNSTRASNSDPMIVSAWISINQDKTPVTVYAHINATTAPSASDPYGTFRLDYCGKAASGGGCMMNGYIQAGNGTLSYYESDSGGGGGGGGNQTTALQLTSVGTTSGTGSLNAPDNQGGQVAFDFAYDRNYFLRSTNGTPQCFNRDATAPGTGLSVWQYGLYDSSTGDRINRNSGFPIQFAGSDGKTYQGYIGYYGLNSQPGAPAPTDGSTVQKVDYSNGAATTATYKVLVNGGRLTRFKKQTTTLKAIDQIQFNAFVNSVTGSGLPDPNAQYVMNWDESSQKFIVTGEIQCGQNGCQTGPLSNNQASVSVDPSFWSGMGLQGWSQSLGGGDLFIALNAGGTPLDTTAVVYHSQDLVYPGDTVPTPLYCVNNCPSAASIQAYFQQSGSSVTSPYLASTYNNFQPATTAVSYGLDSSGTLIDSSQGQVVDINASDYQNYPQFQQGVMSGRLVGSLSDLQCGTGSNNGPPQYCDWAAASNADVYYQWQTGPNSWDQFTAVKDGGGAIVKFDAPLNVNFTVPANTSGSGAAGPPYGNYAGTTLVLQYANFGDLWGVPGTCVSPSTNQTVDCNDPTARYVSAFEIPYDPTATPHQGAVTVNSNGATTTYLVKWLNREIRFASEPASTCTTAPENLKVTPATLPTSSGLQDPSSSSSTVYNGAEPTVTSAPRVIQGTVEY